jgi:tetratricopeptide (TPR) repeat protein
MLRSEPTKKVLVLAANPRSQQPLRLEEEVREIEAGLRRSKHRDKFSLEQRWAVRARDLQQALLDVEPNIVHFSGHGARTGELYLEDEQGQPHPVSAAALANLFQLFSNQIHCVILNACYSELQADAIVRHIPYVIGMNTAIGDKAAIKFAVGFYDALGSGRTIEFSHKIGCSAIELDGLGEQLTPILKCGQAAASREAGRPAGRPAGRTAEECARSGRLSREEIQSSISQYKIALLTQSEDGELHFQIGLLYLQLRLFDLALKHLKNNIDLCPESADGYYYVAVALFRGRRPRVLMMQEAQAIERYIETAINLDGRPAKYFLLLALLRFDYYESNGLAVRRPSSRDLVAEARSKEADGWETERLIDALMLEDEDLLSLIRGVN